MNILFVILIALAYCATLFQQLIWSPSPDSLLSPMETLGNSLFSSATQAVELSLGLIGVMTFFLGLMKVAEAAGLLRILANLLSPLMRRLFPDIPLHHPAQGAIIMNLSANLLGLGSAATPFGIKAMQALETLNPHKGQASNAMVLFIAMNTASITLLPSKVIALRSAAGSQYPSDIMPSTLFASLCATAVAIFASKSLQRFFPLAPLNTISDEAPLPFSGLKSYLALASFFISLLMLMYYGKILAPWAIPTLTLLILLKGLTQNIPVYEVFTEGAKEGFTVAVNIIPYLVSILVAMGMLKASGALSLITDTLAIVTEPLGLPAQALPMALMRPLSGSGSLGIMTALINDPSIGPDSYIGYLVSTMMGATDTTFYIIALYFGAIQIKKIRHTLIAALLADITGIGASVFIVNHLYG